MIPKVSILLSSKGYDPFFKYCIDSIVSQTFTNYEVIMVCESGKESYQSLVNNQYYNYRNKFKFFNSRIPGFATCLNFGLHFCKGEYIARIDTDDVMSPERLYEQVVFLDNNTKYSVVGSRAIPIDLNGKVIHTMKLSFFETDQEIKRVLPFRNPLYHASLMIRKSEFLDMGGYKFDFFAQDHECWIRWMLTKKEIKFHNLNKNLYFYRRHPNQETNLSNSTRAYFDISSFLFKFFLKTKNVKYLFGIFVVHPTVRNVRNFFKG
jgi:glycosyltransferase involved in cell wall biosynthesis